MRILYVSSKKGWGGVVTWMYRTALGLEKRGHRVWILSHPESRFTRSSPAGVSIVPKRLGMDCNPLMILYLAGFIRKHGVDLVVTNIQKEVVIGGLAARLCGIPAVRRIGSHDDLSDRVKWRQRHLVDHSIVPCDFTLATAAGRLSWIDPDRYTTIYNGVNPTRFSRQATEGVRRSWGVSADARVIGCTGALSAVKGLDMLISAFAALAPEYSDVALVLTGEGPEESALKDLAASKRVGDRVFFPGFTTEPAKAAAAYDIAVLNSSKEGFPNAVIEYMAAGVPVVSTRVGGVPEVLVDGANGILIDRGDEAALIRSLRRLLDKPELARDLGSEARRTVEDGFSEDRMIDRVEDLFKRLAPKRDG